MELMCISMEYLSRIEATVNFPSMDRSAHIDDVDIGSLGLCRKASASLGDRQSFK